MKGYKLCWQAGLALLLIAPALAAAQAEKPVEVAGQWEMTAETPVGNFTSTVKLERKGDQLTGVTVAQDGKETKLNDLKFTGKTLTFTEDASFNGEEYHLVYTGTVDGDSIKGTFQTSGETMNWSAKRMTVSAAAPVSVAGTWKITVETPNGSRERTLVLKQQGDKLAGTVTGPMDESIPVEDVSVSGKLLRFSVSSARNGQTVKRTYTASVDGDSLNGTIEGGNQTRSFTGKREAAPAPLASLAGTWKLAVQAPDQTYHPTVTLSNQEGKWSGTLVDEQGDKADLKELVVNGSKLDFSADLDTGGMLIHLKFSGSMAGDRLSGTIEANGTMLPTTGERPPKA